MISKAYDVAEKPIADELLRLARLDKEWVAVTELPDGSYAAKPKVPTRLFSPAAYKYGIRAADVFGWLATSRWLIDGPKLFRPTEDQCSTLEQIEVRLELHDYSQPYPALLVDFPGARYAPYTNCICYHADDGQMIVCVLQHENNMESGGIVTTIRKDGRSLEESIQTFDESCAEDGPVAALAIRVAINSCLALVNFGCQHAALFPKDVERDKHFARHAKNQESRDAARQRLATAVSEVRFSQDIKLHQTRADDVDRGPSPTGRERGFGWVRGHWKMQAHGPAHSLRKRILVKPYMVRADKLVGELCDTSAEYRA